MLYLFHYNMSMLSLNGFRITCAQPEDFSADGPYRYCHASIFIVKFKYIMQYSLIASGLY